MKHIVWAFIAVLAIAGGTGCNKMHGNLLHKNKACSQCGGQGCPSCGKGGHAHGHANAHDMNAVHNQNGDPNYYGGQGGQGGACPNCGPGAGQGGYVGQGPGQVAYPYYTTRGPRDFLMNNPPELGP